MWVVITIVPPLPRHYANIFGVENEAGREVSVYIGLTVLN